MFQTSVKALRLRFKETQTEFARRMGVATVTVARWETSRPPTGHYRTVLQEIAGREAPDLASLFDENGEKTEAIIESRLLNAAVVALRAKLGQTQQQFATTLGIALRSLVYYENHRPPPFDVIAKCAHLCHKYGLHDDENWFWHKLPAELRAPPWSRDVTACVIAGLPDTYLTTYAR